MSGSNRLFLAHIGSSVLIPQHQHDEKDKLTMSNYNDLFPSSIP